MEEDDSLNLYLMTLAQTGTFLELRDPKNNGALVSDGKMVVSLEDSVYQIWPSERNVSLSAVHYPSEYIHNIKKITYEPDREPGTSILLVCNIFDVKKFHIHLRRPSGWAPFGFFPEEVYVEKYYAYTKNWFEHHK